MFIMNQNFYDVQKNGFYRNRVENFFVDKLERNVSMTDSHYHPYFEIYFLLKGKCRTFVEHSLFYIEEGDILILPEGIIHRTQYENDSKVERITFSFTKEAVLDLAEEFNIEFIEENFKLKLIHTKDEKKETFKNLLLALLELNENQKKDKISLLQKKSLILQILLFIIEISSTAKAQSLFFDETTSKIQNCAKYIFNNFNEDISLSFLSKMAGMSETYFSKKFSEITSYSFKEYLINVRLKNSIKLLSTSKLSVTEVALLSGFSDGNYFGEIFRKKIGISPKEFRKMTEKKEAGKE